MESISKLRAQKLKKINRIKALGLEVYPLTSKRTFEIGEILKNFSKLSSKKEEIIIAGRIKAMRSHGSMTFLDIEGQTGKIQAFFEKNKLGEKGYLFFQENFDIGDFIEISGVLFKTKQGEKTVEVRNFRILSKALLPLPAKWHGFKDIEERYRKRYLDLIMNEKIREKFELRSKIIKEIRNFLERQGFLEVETPILQPLYGGAKAEPFKTHLKAFKMDMYLRISPELYLKRLLVGGFEKIFEIGKCFRNEGVDRFHNPDFTMIEFYWAYADYKKLMQLTEKLFGAILKKLFRKPEVNYAGKTINFASPWKRIEFQEIFRKFTSLNLENINEEKLKLEAKKQGIEIRKGEDKNEIADKIFKKLCQPKIFEPTFIIHHPSDKSSLAKTLEQNPKKLASFQLIAGGWELVWAYSELNNPIEQRKRFEKQKKLMKAGFKEAHPLDEDFIEALEYGMPPAAGFGMGIDRLVALLTDSHSLREVILFPIMRPK